jgi:Kef-type K+ transport system membrane component KefB
VPFLFVSIGMKTDFSAFGASGNLLIVLLTVIGLIGSKLFSGWFAMRITGFSNGHGLCAGLMTVPQLSATLAAAAIGKDLGMLSDDFFNAIIVLSIITTLPIPNLVRFVIEKFKLDFTDKSYIELYKVPESPDQDELLW